MSEKANKEESQFLKFPTWSPDDELSQSSLGVFQNNTEGSALWPSKTDHPRGIMQSFGKGDNLLLLTALNQGVNEVEILSDSVDRENLIALLNGVEPQMVSLHLSFESGHELINGFNNLASVLTEKGSDLSKVRGSFRLPGKTVFPYLAEDISTVLPGFSYYYFFANGDAVATSKVDQLYQIFLPLLKYLEKGRVSPESILEKAVFRLYIGNDFVSELSKIRAFYRIWNLLTDELKVKHVTPDLEVSISSSSYGDDIYYNLIRSTAAALSSIAGGAVRLHFPGSIATGKTDLVDPASFVSRMHANISHLIEKESLLNNVADPLAGSYLIEELTEQLAESAWKKITEGI